MGYFATRLAHILADAEKGETAVLFPSGTAALCLALLACTGNRRKVLIPVNCYHGLRPALDFLSRAAAIEPVFFDPSPADALIPHLDGTAAALVLETFASWTLETLDIEAISAACRAVGTRLIVDNTAATPLRATPIASGADLVVHSLAKYLSNGRAFGGVCVAAPGEAANLLTSASSFGFLVEEFPDTPAEETLRGWDSLPERIAITSHHAGKVLPMLAQHRGIAKCFTPSVDPAARSSDALFPSLFGVKFTTSRDIVEARCRAPVPVELGPGWGGPRSRMFLVPQKYWHTRPEFRRGEMARLYVGPSGIEGILESIEDLFAPAVAA